MIRIYHNNRCSKSRATLALLAGRDVEVIHYLDTPPSASEIRHLLQLLGMPARALLRTGEAVYKELNLAAPDRSDDELIAAMAAHPILIERPIVVANGKAVIGRPPEAVLGIV